MALGSIGAGLGATTVNLKGGIGSASAVTRGGLTISALAAANAAGGVTIGDTEHFWAAPFEQNKDLYHRNSPFFWVKDIQTPTFLIWGEGHFPESNQMREFANEMERLYKVYRAKAYPNENFYVMTLVNTRQMMLDMLDFFNQYLKDKVVTGGNAEALSGR